MKHPDPDRIIGTKPLNALRKSISEIIDEPCKRGIRGTAALLGWNPADVYRIYKSDWKKIKIYPEHVEAVRLAHDIALRDTRLMNEARELSERLAQQYGEAAITASRLRRALRKV